MNVTTGTGILNFQGGAGRLELEGTGTPPGAEVIGATFTYGSLGTCQGGNLKLRHLPGVEGRRALWRAKLTDASGTGYVQAGIVDQPLQRAGELADVPLIAPHRQWVEAIGADLAGGQPFRVFGVATEGGNPFDSVQNNVNRLLDPYPLADYGVGPDLVTAIGLPGSGTPAEYTVDSRALGFTPLGVMVPDYVTDAVFDPGDEWDKHLYRREAPAFVLRRSAAVRADPAIITSQASLEWVRQAPPLGAQSLGYHTYASSIYADGVERTYDGNRIAPGANDLLDYGAYRATLPADSGMRKTVDCTVSLPMTLNSNEPLENFTPGDTGPDITVKVRHVESGATSTFRFSLRNKDRALTQTARFVFPASVVQGGGTLEVEIVMSAQSTGRRSVMVFGPLTAALTEQTPNLAGVVMPPGWTAPFDTEPAYQFSLPGWHVPPIRVSGLPGGRTQMVVGSTVTWNRNECRTLLTTAAWPYPGQTRGRR